MSWGVADLEAAAGLAAGDGRELLRVLRAEGLIQAAGHGTWEVTQAGQTLSSASAARKVTRSTAERALVQFLDPQARAPTATGQGSQADLGYGSETG